MDVVISIILFGFMLVLLVLLVTEPLTGRRRTTAQDSQVLSSLLAERDRVLNILKELDFDASLGKIPAETYSSQRLSLMQQGAEILRKIDQLASVPAADTGLQSGLQAGLPARIEDPVEALLSARRASLSAGAVRDDDKAESLLASRRKNRIGKPGMLCPHCGNPLETSDRFCPACGRPVQ